jgi:hypothetical protein
MTTGNASLLSPKRHDDDGGAVRRRDKVAQLVEFGADQTGIDPSDEAFFVK